MKREIGYYWVKKDDNWIIGELLYCGQTHDCLWYLTGTRKGYMDSDFDEINETRLTSPAETGAQQ